MFITFASLLLLHFPFLPFTLSHLLFITIRNLRTFISFITNGVLHFYRLFHLFQRQLVDDALAALWRRGGPPRPQRMPPGLCLCLRRDTPARPTANCHVSDSSGGGERGLTVFVPKRVWEGG